MRCAQCGASRNPCCSFAADRRKLFMVHDGRLPPETRYVLCKKCCEGKLTPEMIIPNDLRVREGL